MVYININEFTITQQQQQQQQQRIGVERPLDARYSHVTSRQLTTLNMHDRKMRNWKLQDLENDDRHPSEVQNALVIVSIKTCPET